MRLVDTYTDEEVLVLLSRHGIDPDDYTYDGTGNLTKRPSFVEPLEADRLIVALRNGSEPSELLKPVVQRAYFDYCRTKGVLN